jgi:tetratricopeptide (TPR) repeat protein
VNLRFGFGFRLGLILLASALLAQPAHAGIVEDCNQQQDADKAIAACTVVLETMKMDDKNLGLIYAHRGTALFNKAEYDRAVQDFNEAIRLYPTYPALYNGRGNALTGKAEFDRAMKDFDEAIRQNPNYFNAYEGRAKVWFEKGDLDRAIADSDEAIRLNPTAAVTFNNRGNFWRKKGDLDKSLADLDEAIRLAPKYANAYSNRGETWRQKGDLEHAIEDQNRAIEINPGIAVSFVLRGDTLRYKGDYPRALADYDQALVVLPDYIAAFTGRGLTYEKLGDLARAKEEFQKALSSQSHFRTDVSGTALETARARLAALRSGAVQPTIPPAPSKTISPTTIPAPDAIVPTVAPSVGSGHERRVALVLGNSGYKNVVALGNPAHDSEAIAATLRAVGFQSVTLVKDSTRTAMVEALRKFAREADNADWAVVYYAGHGIEMNGANYLIPVDARLATDQDVESETVALDQVLTAVDGAKKLKLVLLDACRDNPFAQQIRKTAKLNVVASSASGGSKGTRSIGNGLAEVRVAGASLVVFAAKNGQTALDGEGHNSPFAVAVTQRVATPGVEINKVFRLVRDDVMEATAGRQEPYTYGSLPAKEDFYFVAK